MKQSQWWREAILYQIYPRSFQDSNGDGIGDLRGIINRIDHLKDLGINTVWICPFYDSPDDDNGYDIRDYRKIHSEFGDMETFEELLEKLHAADIRLVIDMVVNHSSDEHHWFQEAIKSKDNQYSDYYIFKDADDESRPPNNWVSIFGGSTWKWCEQREQFFLHLFSKKQPDLNWENERVRDEIVDMMHYWMEKGVDGFRLDVINFLSKPEEFLDASEDQLKQPDRLYARGPKIHDYMQELNSRVFSHYDMMTVGETPAIDAHEASRYCNPENKELNMVFSFEHMEVDHGPGGIWDVVNFDSSKFLEIIVHWQKTLDEVNGWNSNYLENHDQARLVSRITKSKPELEQAAAKALALLLLSLRGTPYIYQGQEFGLSNTCFNDLSEFRDVWSLNFIQESRDSGLSDEEILEILNYRSRDHARVPVPWDESRNWGFSSSKPWIRTHHEGSHYCRKAQLNDEKSVLSFYKSMIQFRKSNPLLSHGSFRLIDCRDGLIHFCREDADSGDRLDVVVNLSLESQSLEQTIPAQDPLISTLAMNEDLKTLPAMQGLIFSS